jgi:hypothetical protein
MSGGAEAAQSARARLLGQVSRLFPDDSGHRARAFSVLWDVPEDTAAVLSRFDDNTMRAAIMGRAGKLQARHATLPTVPSSPNLHHQGSCVGAIAMPLQLHYTSPTLPLVTPHTCAVTR